LRVHVSVIASSIALGRSHEARRPIHHSCVRARERILGWREPEMVSRMGHSATGAFG
jgi:hypothetical protein